MRLIDADALYDSFERTSWMDNADRDIAEEVAENAPTVAEDNNVPVKHPDPITGLVPCGCGGKVEQEDFHNGFFPYSRVTCRGCWTDTTRCRRTTKEAHEMARIGWNASHGYTAPPRPGAIGPGTGGMAPNGEGAEE